MTNINEHVQVISFAYCRILFWGCVCSILAQSACVCQQHHSAAKLANTVLNYLNRTTIYWAQKAILLPYSALLHPQVVCVILCTARLENCGPRAKKSYLIEERCKECLKKMDGFYEGRHGMEL